MQPLRHFVTKMLRPVGTGLTNFTNVCYMNSVLQCLADNPFLREYFLSGAFKDDINLDSKESSKGSLACAFCLLLAKLRRSNFKAIQPVHFKSVVAKIVDTFDDEAPHDAHEWLIFLLTSLHEDLNKVKIKAKLPEQDNKNLSFEQAVKQAHENNLKIDDSVIMENFYGYEVTEFTCEACAWHTMKVETVGCLSLPVVENLPECSLEDCLNLYTAPQKMEAKCDECKSLKPMVQRRSIYTTPRFLILHLIRFNFDVKSCQMVKNGTSVKFDVEKPLDMSKFIVGPSSPTFFSLYAAVNHNGRTFRGGHYIAHCKDPTGRWLQYDDEVVSPMSELDVATDDAYILFYMDSRLEKKSL